MAHFQQLFNLLADEQEFYKHLLILLDTHAHNSLLSLSAYASVAPAPAARAIIAVAGCLAGADDAMRRYASSVEAWISEVRELKDLDQETAGAEDGGEIRCVDDLSSVASIILTLTFDNSPSRSLKRMKKQRLSPIPPSSSCASGSQVTLTRPSVSDLSDRQPRLDALRISAVKRGLGGRCRAMIDCGRTWMEMGKAGLRVLEGAGCARGGEHANVRVLSTN